MSAEDIRTLFKAVGQRVAHQVVQSCVRYPRTSDVQDAAIFEADFGEDLKPIIADIENSIELRATSALYDAVVLLQIVDDLKVPILLARADYLVVNRGGFNVIKLSNEAVPNSGRSISVEVNACRNELLRYIRSKGGSHGLVGPICLRGVLAGLIMAVAFLVGRELARK
jgi:hypothetical protein